jgi:hypothetical protein
MTYDSAFDLTVPSLLLNTHDEKWFASRQSSDLTVYPCPWEVDKMSDSISAKSVGFLVLEFLL